MSSILLEAERRLLLRLVRAETRRCVGVVGAEWYEEGTTKSPCPCVGVTGVSRTLKSARGDDTAEFKGYPWMGVMAGVVARAFAACLDGMSTWILPRVQSAGAVDEEGTGVYGWGTEAER